MEEEDNVNIPIRSRTQNSLSIPIRKSKVVTQKTALQKTFDNTGGIARGFNTSYGESKYDDYLNWDAQIGDDIQKDINENRASQQSWQAHLGIGAVRTVAKAATEVLKLPGVIGGIAMSPFAEENEGFETAFNNQWIKFFDGLNEEVKETLPVYVKESVANGDFFDKIGSSAFYATEGADGLGYMVGALAPGGLFKYFGGAGKLFGASIKAAKLAKYGKGIEAGRKAIKAANITINNIDSYMIPAFNTIAEAGAESKGVWDGIESRKEDAHKEYMSKLDTNDPRYQNAISLRNEELDQLRRSGEISLEEYGELSKTAHITAAETMFEKDFKEQKALAAQNSFFKNVVWLAGPNYIQAKLLFGKTPSKVLLDKIGGLGEKTIKNTVKQGVKNFTKGFASEGAEEVGQTAVEHRNTEQGLKFKLGDDRGDDYNPLTFGDDFIKTLGTTEGQIAGFLGGILGGPMSAVGGYFQNKSDRIQTERLREKINGASTAYADIKNTNIYEQEEYTNPETGEVDFRDKEVDGKKVFIPENVAKVKKALDLIEKDSNDYDNAVEDGDIEKIEQFRNKGEFNVIANFIGEDEVTLDALHEHLKVAFPTENSKDISDEQVKVNKTNLERIDKIMKKAKHLQKDFVSFKDMSTSIIRINHPEITEESTKEEKKKANEHLEDFLNRTSSTFLSERAEEYEAKQVLNKLEQQKLELENNSTKVEIENIDYIQGKTEDIYKQKKVFNNPRLELVNNLIDKVKKQLEGYEENTNSKIWDNKYLNEQFAKEVEKRKKIQTQNSPEQITKNDKVITAVKNATTEEEVAEIEKTAPKEVIANPVIKKEIDTVKNALAEAKRRKDAEEIANATQEDNDFNDTTTYTDLNGTEGSPVTDELTPEDEDNSTAEEIEKVKNEEVLADKGAQVISSYLKDDDYGKYKSGETIPFMFEQYGPYLEYEKTPVNKVGKEVKFEINTNPGPNENLNKALKMLEKNDFSNPEFLISYLPINAVFEEGIKAPMETRRANGKLDVKKDKNGKDQFYIDPASERLRINIVNHLRNGGSINDITTTIQDQYKGLLKVDNNKLANNNILELNGVTDLKYVRDNLHVVDSFGNLMNIQSGKTVKFINDKVKSNAAGEIYLMIPQANGKPFPLKLNIKKINESEAVLLYEIYKEILINEKSLDTTVSETNPELQEAILTGFAEELKIIGGNKNDIKLQDIVDLLIYQSDNIKSKMQIENGVLYFGENEANIDNIEEFQNAIINFLIDSKRHQIKINPKSATDNTRTNLKSNAANYIKYLIDNLILSTNAVVNEPTFQGYTNIYLNTGITVNNQPQAEAEKVAEFPLQEGETLIDKVTDKKGNTHTTVSLTTEKEGLKKTKFLFNRSDKNVGQRNMTSISPEKLSSDFGFEIPKDNIPEGTEVTRVKEIRETDKSSAATVTLKDTESDESWDAEIVITKKQNQATPPVEDVVAPSVGKPITGLSITYTPTGKESQTYTIDKNKIFNSKGEEVFKADTADRRKIFANVAVKEGRAKVIKDKNGVKYVVNNKQQIMSTATGKIMEWVENHPTRLFLNAKYNDLVKPVVSEQSVEIKTDNTGLNESFESEPKVGSDVLNKIKNFTENKSKVVSNIELENQKRDLEFNNKIEFLKNNDILLATHFLLSKKGIVENYGSATSVLTTILKIKYSEAEKLVNEHTNAGKTKDFKFGDEYNYTELDFKLKRLLENKSENTRNSQESFVSLSEDNIIGQTITASQPFNKGNITGIVASIKPNNIKKGSYSIILTNGEKVAWNKEANNFVWVTSNDSKFTSLSEIKGTVENTQLNETQAEVFKKVTNIPSATEMRLLNKASDVLKNNPGELTDIQRQRLEEAAVKYPETYKKLCK